eukprot:TRINITY_DN50047_c0_g1_i1.p1 TRINITY_DN50047_c0_g1~~TRINITY_DN50047_c0_g1_i1.p1  ORF type:complete len:177 (+),score=85.03 TRINITY_DN50047_c0_g1_i1:99-629(+)
MDVIHRVTAVVILDSDGRRIFTKYYDPQFAGRLEKQQAFEKRLHEKTHSKAGVSTPKEGGDITIFDSHTVLYRLDQEVYFYVVGSVDENEVVLSQVLECLYDTLAQLLKGASSIEKRSLLENYDLLLLTVDETIDDGVILQLNGSEVFQLVSEHASDAQDPAGTLKQKVKETFLRK